MDRVRLSRKRQIGNRSPPHFASGLDDAGDFFRVRENGTWLDVSSAIAYVLLQPSCEGDTCMSTTSQIYSATVFKASLVHTHAAHRRRWKMQLTDSQNREAL
jgi:hypothetical protein